MTVVRPDTREGVLATEDIFRQHINPALQSLSEDLGGASSVSLVTSIVQMLLKELYELEPEAADEWLRAVRITLRDRVVAHTPRWNELEARRRPAVEKLFSAVKQ